MIKGLLALIIIPIVLLGVLTSLGGTVPGMILVSVALGISVAAFENKRKRG